MVFHLISARCQPCCITASKPRWPRPAVHRLACSGSRNVRAQWATRFQELHWEDSADAKIQSIAAVLGVPEEQVANMVKMRPGLLLLTTQVYRQKVDKLAMAYSLSVTAAAQLAVENPQLLLQ